MNNIFKKIGKGIETIFTVFATVLTIGMIISWGVTIVLGSYGLAIQTVQWFSNLI